MRTLILSNSAGPPSLTAGKLRIEDLQRRQRDRAFQITCGVVAAMALFVLLLVLTNSSIISAAATVLPIVVPATMIWLWRQPVRGLYVLFGSAVLLPEYPDPRDRLGNLLPFFVDLKQWTHTGVIFSLAEILMILTLLIWLLKGISRRNLRFDRGSLLLPIGLYMSLVFVAEVHGVMSGGDFRTSLWEVRSQAYMLIAYIMTCNLIKTRSHIMVLVWTVLVLAAWRSIQGTYDYFFYIRPLRAAGNIIEDLGPHEQAYFFNGFLTAALVFGLFAPSRRIKRFTLLLLPFVIIAELADQRRASMLALGIMLLFVTIFTWKLQPERRRLITCVVFTLMIVFPPYYMAFHNSKSVLATPARAVASTFQPNDRDKQSNQYRVIEDKDIMVTLNTSPIIGYGFGKPMLNPFHLINITNFYEWAFIMPHNSILWVWMRLGTLGYLLLWFMIGLAVVQISQFLSHTKDRFLQCLALFVLLMIVQQVIISYVDLQWSNYRTMIVTGVLFALVSRVTSLAASDKNTDEGVPPASRSQVRKRAPVPVPTPVPLAVVGGRLKTVAKR